MISEKPTGIYRRIMIDPEKLVGLRMMQEEAVDSAGWRAATYRWYLDRKRRCLSELGCDLVRVIWARCGAMAQDGLTLHLLEREIRRAWPAIQAMALLFMRPGEPRLGRLRKVFRYTYGHPDRRTADVPAS